MAGQNYNRDQVRKKIIQSALHLFNHNGFAATSIDDIMAGAGMTRGGFYSYFQSKRELYAEAISHFVTEKQETIALAETPAGRATRLLLDYLSRSNCENIETGSPLVVLPNEISRSNHSVREAQETALKLMIDTFEQGMGSTPQPPRQVALALTSLCLGGMVLARGIEDRGLADELREAAMMTALRLGKWNSQ